MELSRKGPQNGRCDPDITLHLNFNSISLVEILRKLFFILYNQRDYLTEHLLATHRVFLATKVTIPNHVPWCIPREWVVW